jgi:hypothetical protein
VNGPVPVVVLVSWSRSSTRWGTVSPRLVRIRRTRYDPRGVASAPRGAPAPSGYALARLEIGSMIPWK